MRILETNEEDVIKVLRNKRGGVKLKLDYSSEMCKDCEIYHTSLCDGVYPYFCDMLESAGFGECKFVFKKYVRI